MHIRIHDSRRTEYRYLDPGSVVVDGDDVMLVTDIKMPTKDPRFHLIRTIDLGTLEQVWVMEDEKVITASIESIETGNTADKTLDSIPNGSIFETGNHFYIIPENQGGKNGRVIIGLRSGTDVPEEKFGLGNVTYYPGISMIVRI